MLLRFSHRLGYALHLPENTKEKKPLIIFSSWFW
jgi:hypothetical protein